MVEAFYHIANCIKYCYSVNKIGTQFSSRLDHSLSFTLSTVDRGWWPDPYPGSTGAEDRWEYPSRQTGPRGPAAR